MPLEIAALAPLSVGTLAWRDTAGVQHLTVIAKGTFEIRPDHRARAVDPYPLFGDLYFEENPGRSLRVASDYVPRKPKVDVLFTGAAYAPAGERVTHRSIRLAMAIGGKTIIDKKLLAVGSRERDRSGTPTPPQPFVHLPLRWELAFGGASSRTNPIGVGEDPGDQRLPSVVDPSNPKRAAGLGPVPPSWIARQEALGGADPAALAGSMPTLSEGMDAYFNSAPPDQQLATLRGDESVLMSGLHPAISEMTWRLPGVRAHAALESARFAPGRDPRRRYGLDRGPDAPVCGHLAGFDRARCGRRRGPRFGASAGDPRQARRRAELGAAHGGAARGAADRRNGQRPGGRRREPLPGDRLPSSSRSNSRWSSRPRARGRRRCRSG